MNETEKQSYVSVLKRLRARDEQKEVVANIAWFKLAEFIRRGEKERAFSLYRLLQHSITDQSFLKKLEADIWFAFDPLVAQDYYSAAAHAYKQEGRLEQALLLYEQLVVSYPNTISYLDAVIELCQQRSDTQKELYFQKLLSLTLLKTGAIEKALDQFKFIESALKDADCLLFNKQLVLSALQHNYTEQVIITTALHNVLDGLLRSSLNQELQQFVAEIEQLNNIWYKDAMRYLQEQA